MSATLALLRRMDEKLGRLSADLSRLSTETRELGALLRRHREPRE